jgi:hypothetical protein
MEKDLKVIYMLNGLIVIAEKIDNNQQVQVRQALALAPGQQKGVMAFMEAFPFTAMDEVITLERGSYIAMSELDDPNIKENYMNSLTTIRAKKSGLILP